MKPFTHTSLVGLKPQPLMRQVEDHTEVRRGEIIELRQELRYRILPSHHLPRSPVLQIAAELVLDLRLRPWPPSELLQLARDLGNELHRSTGQRHWQCL